MAIPSRQIGWSTEDNLLWQISKQLEQLTNVTAKACTNCTTTTSTTAAPAYRVFTALLTQSGGDNPLNYCSDDPYPLTIGVTYTISVADGTADFTNVGAPNNNLGTSFVATGTTPNSWGTAGDNCLLYNTGAPVATVLENTIGNVWFGYFALGTYILNSDSLFTNNKFALFMGNMVADVDTNISCTYSNNSVVYMNVVQSNNSSDNLLINTPIEIRVYN